MKTAIDLSPPRVKAARARRKFFRNFIVLQMSIFLVLLAGFVLVLRWEENARARAGEISARLYAFDSAPAYAAQNLQAARADAAYIEEFLENMPEGFLAEWLDYVESAMPDDANFLRMEFTGAAIVVVAEAADIAVIEAHRTRLLEFFDYVTTGRITRGDGFYTYEIRIVTTRPTPRTP